MTNPQEPRDTIRLATSIPVALRFPDMDPPEGWGRLVDLSVHGAKIESRWALRVGQAVYLTFSARSEMRLENLRARVIHVTWEEGYYVAGVYFDESVDPDYLREALLALVRR